MHCKSKSHLEQAKALKAQPKLPFQGAQSSEELNRTEAELQMAVLTAISNVPLAFHDRLSPTIRKVFPDSKIALKYHSASTKEKMNPITVRIYDATSNMVVTRFLDMCTTTGVTAEAIYHDECEIRKSLKLSKPLDVMYFSGSR